MKKIVLIDHEPYTVRRGEIFYVERLIACGFEVEVWNVSAYLYPSLSLAKSEEKDYVRCCSSYEQIVQQLEKTNIPQTLFVVEVHNQWRHRRIFRLLKEKQCYTIRLSLYEASNLPALPLWQRLKYFEIKNLSFYLRQIGGTLLYDWYKRWYGFKPYDLWITSCKRKGNVLRINQTDYETYKRVKECDSLVEKPYAVFIDQYFPLHPDFAIFYHKKLTGEKPYQECLNKFFSQIEQKYQVEVVIAAHPRAVYDAGTFEGRKIIQYKTPELVKHARFVIMQTSMSISFVMLFDKPVFLITTRQYDSYRKLRMVEEKIARMCRKKVISIEKYKGEELDITPIDREIRKRYIYTYLTSPETENRRNEDIIRDIFLSLS